MQSDYNKMIDLSASIAIKTLFYYYYDYYYDDDDDDDDDNFINQFLKMHYNMFKKCVKSSVLLQNIMMIIIVF